MECLKREINEKLEVLRAEQSKSADICMREGDHTTAIMCQAAAQSFIEAMAIVENAIDNRTT